MAPPAKRRKVVDFKRRTGPAVEDIPFDHEARSDYLTGFRKRKLQRIKHAQEQAAKQEKEMKIESRKLLREQRRKDLETHVQTVNEIIKRSQKIGGGDSDSSDDSEPDNDEASAFAKSLDEGREDEYVDEEKYTTVTVEPMRLSGDGETSEEEERSDAGTKETKQSTDGRTKRIWTKEKPTKSKPKPKKKKFRYESKVERKATRSKQASKNSAAAKARREAATK